MLIASTRSELGELVPPHAIDAALRAWRAEGERLAATACAVDLVERALRGETFRPRLLRSCVEVQLELLTVVALPAGMPRELRLAGDGGLTG